MGSSKAAAGMGWRIAGAALLAAAVLALPQTAAAQAPPAVNLGPGVGIELPPVDVQSRAPVGAIDTGYSSPKGLDGSRTISGATNMPVPLIEQPRSASVVTPETIRLQQPNTPAQLFNSISSVVFTANGEGVQGAFLTVRGLSAGRQLVDGLSSYDFGTEASALYGNIERVEVYKGPSAFLQGATNLGGTVNFVTKQPLQTPQYTYNLGAGFTGGLNRPQTRGGFDLTGPITDTLSYRAIGQIQYDQGYQSPAGYDNLRGALSPSLLWKPTGDTSVLASVDYFRGDTAGLGGEVPARGTVIGNKYGVTLPYNQRFSEANLARADLTLVQPRVLIDHRLDDVWTVSGGANYTYSKYDRTLLYNTGLASDDRTLGRAGTAGIYLDDEYTARASITGKFNVLGRPDILVFGGDTDHYVLRQGRAYSLAVTSIDVLNPVFGNDITSRTRMPDYRQTTFQNGVFVNDRLTILPHVDLFGGARFDRVDEAYQSPGSSKLTVGANGITSNAGVSWEFLPNIRAYYGYSEAFAAPDTDVSATGQPFAPESGNQHEVGIKAVVSNRLTVQGALFDINRDNVLTPDPNNPLFSVAVGAVRVRGGELEAAGTILPGWEAKATYSFLEPTIIRDNSGNVGHRLADIPRNSLRLFTTYEFPEISSLKGLGVGAGMRFNTSSFADNANTVKLPQYAVFDALAYKNIGEKYRLQLNLYNVADEHYYPNGRNAARIYAGQPFSALFTLQIKM